MINGTHLHLVTGSGDPWDDMTTSSGRLTASEAAEWITALNLPKEYEDGHLGLVNRDDAGGDYELTRRRKTGGWVATIWCDGTTVARCHELARTITDTAAAMNGTASPN